VHWRKFLKRYIYKEEFQDMLREEDLSPTGNVDNLIDRLVEEAEFDFTHFLEHFRKDDLKEICEDFDSPVSGTKDDLMGRVFEEIIEISEKDLRWMGFGIEEEVEPQMEEPASEPEVAPKADVPRPTPERIVHEAPMDRGFHGLVQTIEVGVPHRRYSTEEGYATDLRGFLAAKGYNCRAEAGESTADIEVDGRFPVEVKKNPRLGGYDRLIGQLVRHCRSKGCAIAVICDVKRGDLFEDFRHNLETSLTLADRIAIVPKPF